MNEKVHRAPATCQLSARFWSRARLAVGFIRTIMDLSLKLAQESTRRRYLHSVESSNACDWWDLLGACSYLSGDNSPGYGWEAGAIPECRWQRPGQPSWAAPSRAVDCGAILRPSPSGTSCCVRTKISPLHFCRAWKRGNNGLIYAECSLRATQISFTPLFNGAKYDFRCNSQQISTGSVWIRAQRIKKWCSTWREWRSRIL